MYTCEAENQLDEEGSITISVNIQGSSFNFHTVMFQTLIDMVNFAQADKVPERAVEKWKGR